jgi:hypothetical protein
MRRENHCGDGESSENLRKSTRRRSLFFCAGQPHLAEKYVAQLLGRAKVETLAGKFEDLGLETRMSCV